MLKKSLLSGQPPNIAMSVVLTAKLHTTMEINGLQILAESKKFGLCDSVIFHLKRYDTSIGSSWQFHRPDSHLCSTAARVLQIRLHFFAENFAAKLSTEARYGWSIMQINRSTKDDAIPEWEACCARDALSFLVGSKWHKFPREVVGNRYVLHHSRIFSTLRALIDMDILSLNSHKSTAIEYRNFNNYRRTAASTCMSFKGPRFTFFESLCQLLNWKLAVRRSQCKPCDGIDKQRMAFFTK